MGDRQSKLIGYLDEIFMSVGVGQRKSSMVDGQFGRIQRTVFSQQQKSSMVENQPIQQGFLLSKKKF
jgi:hypothetical protein